VQHVSNLRLKGGYEYSTRGSKSVTLVLSESLPLSSLVTEKKCIAVAELSKTGGMKEALVADLFVTTGHVEDSLQHAICTIYHAGGKWTHQSHYHPSC
jgi:hypothetical protein